MSADRGGGGDTTDPAVKLDIHKDKIGAIAFGKVKRVSRIVGIADNLVAEVGEVAFKR